MKPYKMDNSKTFQFFSSKKMSVGGSDNTNGNWNVVITSNECFRFKRYKEKEVMFVLKNVWQLPKEEESSVGTV